MDEIAVSFFLIGRDNTLPLEIWSRLRCGMTPEINAISTVIFVFSLIMIVLWYRLRTRAAKKRPTLCRQLRRRWHEYEPQGFHPLCSRRQCCGRLSYRSVAAGGRSPSPLVDGDHYEICHEVRDGHKFAHPPATRKYDVVLWAAA